MFTKFYAAANAFALLGFIVISSLVVDVALAHPRPLHRSGCHNVKKDGVIIETHCHDFIPIEGQYR